MPRSPQSLASWLFVAGMGCALIASVPVLSAQSSVRQVKIMGNKEAVEIEVEASDRIVPQTQVLSGPDRLVIDFPNSVPGAQLRSQSVNRGKVKDLRIGLFQSKPPITRIVLDLTTAQSYQIFPYGRTVMIKVLGAPEAQSAAGVSGRPGLVNANYTTGAERLPLITSTKPLEVSFREGLLTIQATKATLSEVLYAVQQRTGADIAIPSGAEQEKVVANLGPAPAQEVLAHLLNGSRFNFLILNSVNDPRQLDRVILSPRGDPSIIPISTQASNDPSDDDGSVSPALRAEAQSATIPPPPVEAKPRPAPEPQPEPEEDPQQ